MLSRIKLNWELFKVTDSDIKEKITYSQQVSSSSFEPQIQDRKDVELMWKSPWNEAKPGHLEIH